MPTKPLRTKAFVLRRVNYGETDRILTLLTPEGQISVRARGVRKEKSKLAGGIEMFCLSDVVIHQGKSDLGILTSAKMLIFYQNILTDLTKLEFASAALKEISRATAQVESPDFFKVTEQIFTALQSNYPLTLIQIWFHINLKKLLGEELNFFRDKSGAPLSPDQIYTWDSFSESFTPSPNGTITANHIKLLRLMSVLPLSTISKIKDLSTLLPEVKIVI